jgi:hypothetical protein
MLVMKGSERMGHRKPLYTSPALPPGWVAVPVEAAPEQLRAAQLRSELGGYACSNLAGAYDMLAELYAAMLEAAPKVTP